MRNFEERKAEVFRRSENRIKKRKKNRNRILACCIPLCLCIAVLSAIYIKNVNLFSDKRNSAESMDIDNLSGTSGFTYTSLEITNNTASSENIKTENDISNIEKIYNIIHLSFATENEQQKEDAYDQNLDAQNSGTAVKDNNNRDSLQLETTAQSYTEKLSYTITFNSYNGTKVIYTLNGNILTDESTNQKVSLTDSQLSELQKALDLVLK